MRTQISIGYEIARESARVRPIASIESAPAAIATITASKRRLSGRAGLGTAACRFAWALFLAATSSTAPAQDVNDRFKPDADAPVYALAVQADGKLVVGGYFTHIAGQSRTRLARLLADGSLDTDFAATVVNGPVGSIALQPDGKLVIGGQFTQVGVQPRNNIARLDAAGTVDATYNPDVQGDVINAFAQQADGKLVIGGQFTKVGGVGRNNVARLDASGNLDASFNPDSNGAVLALLVQQDRHVVLGGAFTSLAGVQRNHVARLDENGNLDAFDPDVGGDTNALALQPDGSIVLAGSFTTVGLVPRNSLARVMPDGSVDNSFSANADDAVSALALQADGKLLVGGAFTTINSISHNRIARLDGAGNPDATFAASANSAVYALATQTDGKLVIGGAFTASDGFMRNYVARLEIDGSLDRTADPDADGAVEALMIEADGKLVIGGDFTAIGATTRHYIARLNPDGTPDDFDPNADGSVRTLAQRPDGKLVVGGDFTKIGSPTQKSRSVIARLDIDGNVDAFNPGFGPGSNVYSVALQPDGKLVVGGYFSSITNPTPQTRHYLARFDADDSLDAFDPNPNGLVRAVALTAQGKLVVGGQFGLIGNPTQKTRNYIARLTSDGSVDSFNPALNVGAFSGVYALLVQPDGKLVVGGYFSKVGTTTRNCIARFNANDTLDTLFDPNANDVVFALALQADGKLLVAGQFTMIGNPQQPHNHLARLNPDGTVDADFNVSADSFGVEALALQADGKLVLGGFFNTIDGTTRHNIARLGQPEGALQSLVLNGTSTKWLRAGSAPELALPPELSVSFDGVTYAAAGPMSRIVGGWAYGGVPLLPVGQTFYLRARGELAGGSGDQSQGVIESTRQFHVGDSIFADGFD